MPRPKPIASLSLDLDNQWAYMKTHGDPAWESLPSYLDVAVPRALHALSARKLTITFFVVGLDAAQAGNHAVLRSIAEQGHEIGNHSFRHEPWLHLYSRQELEGELQSAEQHIEQATGQRPRGFRGPGFSHSPELIDLLAKRGYLYDASTFPTFLGPVARAYYFMKSNLDKKQKQDRGQLFGPLSEGLRSNRIYRWKTQEGALVEVPVTTVPWVKLPFHVSYLLYLAGFSRRLALGYFRAALWLCRLNQIQPSLLLHPLDFLSREDVPELAFFPAMDLSFHAKAEFVARVLDVYCEKFEVLTIEQQVRRQAKG